MGVFVRDYTEQVFISAKSLKYIEKGCPPQACHKLCGGNKVEESIYHDILEIASNRSAPGIILLGKSGKLIYCNGSGQKIIRELLSVKKKDDPKPKKRTDTLPPLIKKLHARVLSEEKKTTNTVIPILGKSGYYCVSAHTVRPPADPDIKTRQSLNVVMLIEHFISKRNNKTIAQLQTLKSLEAADKDSHPPQEGTHK